MAQAASTNASEVAVKAFESKAADYYDDANSLNFYKQVKSHLPVPTAVPTFC